MKSIAPILLAFFGISAVRGNVLYLGSQAEMGGGQQPTLKGLIEMALGEPPAKPDPLKQAFTEGVKAGLELMKMNEESQAQPSQRFQARYFDVNLINELINKGKNTNDLNDFKDQSNSGSQTEADALTKIKAELFDRFIASWSKGDQDGNGGDFGISGRIFGQLGGN